MGDRVGSGLSCPAPSYPAQSYIPFADEADTNSDSSGEEIQTRGEDISSMLRSIDERKKRMSDLRERFYSDYEVQFPADQPEGSDSGAPAGIDIPVVGGQDGTDSRRPDIIIPDEIRLAAQPPTFAAKRPTADAKPSRQVVEEMNQPELLPHERDVTDSSSESESDYSSSEEDDLGRNYQSEGMDTDDILSNNMSGTDDVDCVNKPPKLVDAVFGTQPSKQPVVQETDLDDELDPANDPVPVTNLDDFPRSPEPQVQETNLDDSPRSPVEDYNSRSPSAPAQPEAVHETDLDDLILGDEETYVPATDEVIQRPNTLPSHPDSQSDTDSESDSDSTSSTSDDEDSETSESESEASEPEPSSVTKHHGRSNDQHRSAKPFGDQGEAEPELQTPTLDTLPPFLPGDEMNEPPEEEQRPADSAEPASSNPQDADSERSSFVSTDSDESDEEHETDLYTRDLDVDVETLQISSIEDLMRYSKDHVSHNKTPQSGRPLVQLRSNQDRQPPQSMHRQQPHALPTISERNSEYSESESSLSRSSSINSSFGKADSKVKRRSSKKDDGRKGLERASEPIDEEKLFEPTVVYPTPPEIVTPDPPAPELSLAPDNLASTEDFRPQTKPVARYSFASPRPFSAKSASEIAAPAFNPVSRPRPPPPPVPSSAPKQAPAPPQETSQPPASDAPKPTAATPKSSAKPVPPPPNAPPKASSSATSPKSESKPPVSSKPVPPLPPKKPKPVSVVAPLSNAQQVLLYAPTASPPAVVEEPEQPPIPARSAMASKRIDAAKKAENVESKKSPGVRALVASMEVKVKSETPPVPPPKPFKKKPVTQAPQPEEKEPHQAASEPKSSVSDEEFGRSSAPVYNTAAAAPVPATNGKKAVPPPSAKKPTPLPPPASAAEQKSVPPAAAPPAAEQQPIVAIEKREPIPPQPSSSNEKRRPVSPPPPVSSSKGKKQNEMQRPVSPVPAPTASSTEVKPALTTPAVTAPSSGPAFRSKPAAIASSPKPFSLASTGTSSAQVPASQPTHQLNKQLGLNPSLSSQFNAARAGPAEPVESHKTKSDDNLVQLMAAARRQHAEDVVRELISMDTTIDNVGEDLGSIDRTLDRMSSTNQLILSNPDLTHELDTDVHIGDMQVQTDDLVSVSEGVRTNSPAPAKPPVKESRIDSSDESESESDNSSDDSSSYSTSDDSDDYKEPADNCRSKATDKKATGSTSQKPTAQPSEPSDPSKHPTSTAPVVAEPVQPPVAASKRSANVPKEVPRPEKQASPPQPAAAPRARRSFLSKKTPGKTKSPSATAKEASSGDSTTISEPSFDVDEQLPVKTGAMHTKPAVPQSPKAAKPAGSRPSLADQFNRISQENLSAGQAASAEQKTPSKMSLRDKIKTFEATNKAPDAEPVATEYANAMPQKQQPQQQPEQPVAAPKQPSAAEHGNIPLHPKQRQQTRPPPPPPPPPTPPAVVEPVDSTTTTSSDDDTDEVEEVEEHVGPAMPAVPSRRSRPQLPAPVKASGGAPPPPKPKPRGSLENLASNDNGGQHQQHYANVSVAPPTAPRKSSRHVQQQEDPRYRNLPIAPAAKPADDNGLHYATSEVALNLIGLEEDEANRASQVYEHHAEAMDRELQRRSQEVSQAAIDSEFAKVNQAVKRRSQESPVLPPKSPFATLTSSRLTSQGSYEGGSFRYEDPGSQDQQQQQQSRYKKHGTLEPSSVAEAAAFARAKRASKSLGPKERRQKKTKSAELADQRYKGVELEVPPPSQQQQQQQRQRQQAGKKFASSNDLLSSESGSSDSLSEVEEQQKQQQRRRPRQPPPPLPPHGSSGRLSQHETTSSQQHQKLDDPQYYNLSGQHMRARSMDLLEPTLPDADAAAAAAGRKSFGRGPASVASSMMSVNVANKDSDELAQLLERYLHQKREEKIHGMLTALRAQDPAKYRKLMARYKEEISLSGLVLGAPVAAFASAQQQPALRPAGSTSTLLNNLDPGITNVLLGPEGTLRDAGTLQTMLHPSEPQRTVVWDPSQPETPPPAMRPPPKPMPPGLSKSVPPDGWKAVDDHVMELVDNDYNTFTEQVNNLCGRYQSDVEKCRAIFRFLTARCSQPLFYDPQAPLTSLIGCLRGVQAGEVSPHELFKRMCAYAGIHCDILHGYSKGAGYRPGMNLKDNRMFRNTWTAVYVEGCWRFVNVAWGGRRLATGRLGGGAVELRLKCDDFYFLTEPEEHIYEHWPDDKHWQLLRQPIALSHFMRLPLLKSPFFNAGMRLKKGKYDDTLMTQSGRVALKIGVTKFVGVTCQLQNRSDMSTLRGKTLARLIGEVLHVLASPAQPGTYFLNIYVSPEWTSNEHELAASFQVKCAENNFDRLALGRYPEVGFLGATPAAQKFGVSFLTGHGSKTPMDPYLVHSSKDLLRLPLVFSPGLKIAHQMKCYQRAGKSTEQCDSHALLQCRGGGGKQQAAEYWIACPADGYYFFTVYASEAAAGLEEDEELDCVYRLLVDCRRGLGKQPAFPMQTSLFNGCYLHEPMQQHLDVGRKYTFRLEARHCRSVAVVLNGKTWLDLDSGRSGVWSKRLNVGEELGELSIYGQLESEEEGKFSKLLDYDIVQRVTNLQQKA